MTKVLIFSDNHSIIDKMFEIKEEQDPDLVLHAGDFCCEDLVIENIANYYVRGNNDYLGEEQKIIPIEDKTILLVHGHNFLNAKQEIDYQKLFDIARRSYCQIVIFGHTHIPVIQKYKDVLFVNPGSIKKCRDGKNSQTYAILTIDKNEVNVEIKTV